MTSFCVPKKEGAVALDKIVLSGKQGIGMQYHHWLGLDGYLSGEEAEAHRKTVLCREGAAGL